MLVTLLFGVIAFSVVIGVWKIAVAKLPEKGAEEACFFTNAASSKYLSYSFEVSGQEIDARIRPPRGCKKIDKTIPDDFYELNAGGAKEQLNKMVRTCWWMWLEGRDHGIMEQNLVYGKNRCFICYQFQVKEKMSFSAAEFDKELYEKVYDIVDTSGQCAGAGGGNCVAKNAIVPKGYKAVQGSCPQEQKCLLHEENECENKGGSCISSSQAVSGKVPYTKLKCERGKTCYIGQQNVITYGTYVQSSGGKGKIFVDKANIGTFDQNGVYAVTFIAKTDDLLVDKIAELKAYVLDDDKKEEISSIFISRLGAVSEECEIEVGAEAGSNG